MNSALTPREIQARIRSGATLAEVAVEAGVEESAIEGFAGPVLAEREHIVTRALASTVRRRGEGSSHRRLGELVRERLQQRGIDADRIEWDSWRQEDLRWRVVGTLADDAGARTAEFVFDHKARFSIADNTDARWMIGEQAPGAPQEEEPTVDFDDELALIRATSEKRTHVPDAPGDDVPTAHGMYDDFEDTSELDALYDMLSGISEDSVRIYTGFDEPAGPIAPVAEDAYEAEDEDTDADEPPAVTPVVADEEPPAPAKQQTAGGRPAQEPITEPVQDSLVEEVAEEEPRPKPRKRRRAHVPSWDEIMFGGPTN
ncbi:septation protein SepH [Tessaracoccus oleiagri]|uniref:DUF3071 domain-containing protein n=1 Tax=Tessaracoccus oleiagri TaxID=686624 RepID=A0A1G9MLN2_9ACTN|nr:septation protein SepH [Tessaracoccus oleiagri]SDL74807.1 Protein of unknown function [Tessaracoccus oleiagri]